jgi:hypothetical protein
VLVIVVGLALMIGEDMINLFVIEGTQGMLEEDSVMGRSG